MQAPLINLAVYLLPMIFGAMMSIVLLRFLMQYFRLSFANPLGQFIINVSNPLVIPLRRVVPAIGTLDSASLILAFLTHALFIVVFAFILRHSVNLPQIIIWSMVGVICMLLSIFVAAIFVSVISSWVPDLRQQAIIRTAAQLAEPSIAPFRRMMPDLGGIDLSPVLPLILIECIKIFLSSLAFLNRAFILGL